MNMLIPVLPGRCSFSAWLLMVCNLVGVVAGGGMVTSEKGDLCDRGVFGDDKLEPAEPS